METVDWEPDFPSLENNTILPAVHSREIQFPSSTTPAAATTTQEAVPAIVLPEERTGRTLVQTQPLPASRSPSPLPQTRNVLLPVNLPTPASVQVQITATAPPQLPPRPRKNSGVSQPEVIRPNIYELIRFMNPPFSDVESDLKALCKELKIDCQLKIEYNRNYGEFGIIHKAASEGDLDKVKMSIAQGIDPNSQDPMGKTALHYAIKKYHFPIIQYLVGLSIVNLNIQDYKGKAPLHYLSKNKQKDNKEVSQLIQSISLLLINEHRTDLDIQDKKGNTPLIYTVKSKFLPLFGILIEQDANPNLVNYKNKTPLIYASKYGLINCVTLLIMKGATVESKDIHGRRAVHYAAQNNDLNLLVYLKEQAGASVMVPDNATRIPHDLAREREVLWFLEDRFTCRTHPLKVDFVIHPTLEKHLSKIGMSMCPGRNKKNWRRDLDVDIKVLLGHKIESVLSLVRQDEWDSMGISNFRDKLLEVHIESLHFPIVDKWIPTSMDELINNVEMVVDRIKKGRCILIHCNGGKGRTGLLVVSALVALGLEVNDAVQVIRDARPGMIQNPAQLIYARAFKKMWFQSHTL